MVGKRVLRLALLAAIVALCALALAWGPQPVAGTGGNHTAGVAALVTPVPGGPGFYSLSAHGFRPTNPLVEWTYSGMWLYNPDPALIGSYSAALSLPQEATVTKFVVYYFDDSTTHDLIAYLYKAPLDGTSSSSMATVSSTGTDLGPRYGEDTTITSPIIDNQSNSYVALVSLPPDSDGALIAIRVDYEFGVNLPVVMKNY